MADTGRGAVGVTTAEWRTLLREVPALGWQERMAKALDEACDVIDAAAKAWEDFDQDALDRLLPPAGPNSPEDRCEVCKDTGVCRQAPGCLIGQVFEEHHERHNKTTWHVLAVPERPSVSLKLSVDTSAPAVVEAFERMAAANGIVLEREAGPEADKQFKQAKGDDAK